MARNRDLSKLLSTTNGKITGSNLDVSFENISDTGTEGTKVASGTTAQRGSTTGQIRFNTTTNLAEYYDGSDFKSIDSPPTISSISPTSIGESQLGSSQTITITGGNFSNTVTAKIIGNDGTEYTPVSTTRNSISQVTITTPTNLTNANENYNVKITNISGLSASLADALSINATPVFSTAAGSLGTLQANNRAASNLTAISFSDSDSTATVSVTTGSIPSGLTLNSNGTFSGTANAVTGNTTSTFTVTATDGSESATRQYTITVNAPLEIEALIIAGGGGGGTLGGEGGGGGAGGLVYYGTETPKTPNGGVLTLTAGQTYTATIGGAGQKSTTYSRNGTNGGNSSFTGSGISTTTAVGGGKAGAYPDNCGNCGDGENGGSGGGGGGNYAGGGSHSGGSGTSGQGHDGGDGNLHGGGQYEGGGGGGASQAGGSGSSSGSFAGGDGGDGLQYSITGSATYYAGGGGGEANGGTKGSGGQGGGTNAASGSDAPANTGGGGGANNHGGSGVIILKMPTGIYTGTVSGSPTVTTSGSNTIIKFTGTGSYTA